MFWTGRADEHRDMDLAVPVPEEEQGSVNHDNGGRGSGLRDRGWLSGLTLNLPEQGRMDDAVESQPGGRMGKDNRAEFLPVNRATGIKNLRAELPDYLPGGGRAFLEQFPADAVGVNCLCAQPGQLLDKSGLAGTGVAAHPQ